MLPPCIFQDWQMSMKLICLLCGFTALLVARVGVSPVVLSHQAAGPSANQLVPEPHPDTADGLHRMLSDLLLTAKNDDQSKLRSQIAELAMPDYQNWFPRTFGPENGAKLESMYEKSLPTSESPFVMLCTELAKQEGEILIEKVDAAKRYGTLTGPLDEYHANWKKTDASVGPDSQPIGIFYFAQGKFRLNEAFREVRVVSPVKSGQVVPGKLISRIQPAYPEAAQKLRIQGTVSVNVIVHKDGTVMVQNVGAGHPLLAPPAVAAVQQWRYEPTTVNGEPVEIQAKVYVTFALSNQANQQN